MKRRDIELLLRTHVDRRLQVTTTSGLTATMTLNGSATALVTELLRLASIGLEVEAALEANPRVRLNTAACAAMLRWRDLNRASA
jgi:hypothetical protein